MASRPCVAVTGPDARPPVAYWATAFSVWLAGGVAVRLMPANYRQHRKETFQAVIIGGGSDIDPGLYGADDKGIASIDPQRDAFEVEMIEHALNSHLPILGICRGAQLINVVMGGSLYADIRGMRILTSNRRTLLPRKRAWLVGQGRLRPLRKKCYWRINSLHHQAVYELGTSLKIAARDEDQFVQAVESTDSRFILGVQWHPEYLPYLGYQRRLFRLLVDTAHHYRPKVLYQ